MLHARMGPLFHLPMTNNLQLILKCYYFFNVETKLELIEDLGLKIDKCTFILESSS